MMAHPSNSGKLKRLLEYYDGHNIRPGRAWKRLLHRRFRRRGHQERMASVKILRMFR